MKALRWLSRALVQVEELVTGFKSVILEPETVVLGFDVVRLDGTDLLVQSGDDFSSSPKFIGIIPNSDQRFEILGLGSADTQFDLFQGSDEDEYHGKAEKSESQANTGKRRKPRQKLFAMRKSPKAFGFLLLGAHFDPFGL